MTPEAFFENFAYIADAPNGVKKLRELILQLAVRGKLVSQNLDDEPAAILLERIHAEKARLVREKKIRKSDPLPPVTADEAPYELPQGWNWVRLDSTGQIFNGNSVNESGKTKLSNNASGLPFIATKDVGYGRQDLNYENGLRVLEGSTDFKVAHTNAVLICAEGGSAGKKIGMTDRDICFGNKLYANEVWRGINPTYILSVYMTPDFFEQFSSRMTGIIGGIARSEFLLIPVPLPPENEQHRIVAKIYHLMSLCDKLEARQQSEKNKLTRLNNSALNKLTIASGSEDFSVAWQLVRNNFDLLYTTPNAIAKLRQCILQLAVQGKLVPQDPVDEPASILLTKIKEEKERLVRAKLIKQEKNPPNIEDDEQYCEIPRNWAWARLVGLCSVITDGTHQTPNYTTRGRTFISAQNVKPFKFMPQNHRWVSESDFQGYIKNRKPELGDILLTRVGAGIGEAAVIDVELEFAIYVSVGLLKPIRGFIEPDYLVLWLNSPYGRGHSERNTYGKGMSQGNLNLSLIRNFAVSLPPFQEQKRIVSKVDNLMAFCDELEAKLNKTQTKAEKLTAAAVQGLLAV